MKIMNPMKYEEAMKELEGICNQLKKNDMSLEDLIAAHERGKYLYHFCMEKLNKAESAINS